MFPPFNRPTSSNGVLTVRPGLVLAWGSRAEADPATATADIGIVYRLTGEGGTMGLRRQPAVCGCASAATEFVAQIWLSAPAICDLFSADSTAGADALRRFAAGETAAFEHPLTPRARLALDSIRCCPFVGACRDMALTARCHDLLVEFLTAWSTTLQAAPLASIGPDDRVRLAAEILERDLETPPSLADLAAQVGLSETTLKRSFPQIHGTTVFGYIRARRMEEARRLLASGGATVLEAAAHVGYSNPSNFAAAFRTQFGVNPKTFQLRSRRTG